jgi:hypothetical protein
LVVAAAVFAVAVLAVAFAVLAVAVAVSAAAVAIWLVIVVPAVMIDIDSNKLVVADRDEAAPAAIFQTSLAYPIFPAAVVVVVAVAAAAVVAFDPVVVPAEVVTVSVNPSHRTDP